MPRIMMQGWMKMAWMMNRNADCVQCSVQKEGGL